MHPAQPLPKDLSNGKTDSNMMLKGFRYRMYLKKDQEEMFLKHIGACRFVYNLSLEQKIKAYETEKKTLTRFDLNNALPQLKSENEWLKEVNSQSLQQANKHLDSAFKKFFREKKGFPKVQITKEPNTVVWNTTKLHSRF